MVKCKFCPHEQTWQAWLDSGTQCGNPECPTHKVPKAFSISRKELPLANRGGVDVGKPREVTKPVCISMYFIPEKVKVVAT